MTALESLQIPRRNKIRIWSRPLPQISPLEVLLEVKEVPLALVVVEEDSNSWLASGMKSHPTLRHCSNVACICSATRVRRTLGLRRSRVTIFSNFAKKSSCVFLGM
jgi:hypothetical protein